MKMKVIKICAFTIHLDVTGKKLDSSDKDDINMSKN